MSELNKSRRDAVKLMLAGLAAVPVLNLVGMTTAQAAEGEWRPCSLFPGKAVNANGWCASWTLKAG